MTGHDPTTSGSAITMEMILAAADQMEAIGPYRIISGCPIVDRDHALEFLRRRVLFVGDGVVEALRRESHPSTRIFPFRGEMTTSFLGVPIEPWGTRPDHREIMIDMANEIAGEDVFQSMISRMIDQSDFSPPAPKTLHWWAEMFESPVARVTGAFVGLDLAVAECSTAFRSLADVLEDAMRKPAHGRSRARRKW